MAAPPQSQVRATLRRQVSVVLAAAQLLWLALGVLVETALPPRSMGFDRWTFLALLLGIAFVVWRAGVRAVDQLMGPTLDRLAQVAELTAPTNPLTGERLPMLVSESPQGALRQLVERLAEAQEGLAAKVKQLEATNRELAGARADLVRAERLAVVGRLAAGVAHEVGNPLGALVGFVGVAKQAKEADVVKEALSGIEAQADRIHRTVSELMDFARAGKMELGPVPLPSAIAAAQRLIKAHPRWRAMALVVNVANDAPPVRASEHHLVQVLVNLMLNAADACEGKGSVTIAAEAIAPGRMRVAVVDDGPGIAAADRERIFEPFVSTKPVGEGTGLGLAISRQLVEGFGGQLSAVESPRGARFEMTLEIA
jgi:two-component system, NtrC family, sensor kinase